MLWLEDGLSRNTLDAYRRDLRLFSIWLGATHGRTLVEAGHGDLLGYLAHRFEHRAKASSASRLLSTLKRFYRWQVRDGKILTAWIDQDAAGLMEQLGGSAATTWGPAYYR